MSGIGEGLCACRRLEDWRDLLPISSRLWTDRILLARHRRHRRTDRLAVAPPEAPRWSPPRGFCLGHNLPLLSAIHFDPQLSGGWMAWAWVVRRFLPRHTDLFLPTSERHGPVRATGLAGAIPGARE